MRKSVIENQKLTAMAKTLCLKLFGIKYDSYAKYENTTTSTVGRFVAINKVDMWGDVLSRTNRYYIEIKKQFARRHPDLLPKVLGHELCHYYCYVTNKPYCDYNDYFQEELKKHNLPAGVQITDDPKRYVEYCPKCHQIFLTVTRVKASYACSKDRTLLKRFGFIKLHGTYKASQLYKAFNKAFKEQMAKKFTNTTKKPRKAWSYQSQYVAINNKAGKEHQLKLF